MATPSPHEVALICNPQAGGRWRVLADVLDSVEAKEVHRIVTDDIDNVRAALQGLGQRVKLLCIYGGDGTIGQVLNELLSQPTEAPPRLAFLGGGTMNVTAGWCGMQRSAGDNFRAIMRAYLADRLLWREVPLLAVTHGGRTAYGVTFGLGPLARLVAKFDAGSRSPANALALGVQAILGAVTGLPRSFQAILREMEARITVDGRELPYGRFATVFANVTGCIEPFVRPFIGDRTRDSFHFLAYAVSSREFAVMAPLLARAQLPIDPRALLKPVSIWRQAALSLAGGGGLPVDARYVNHPARTVVIETPEELFTLDGEVFRCADARFELRLGPSVLVATLAGPLIRRLVPTDLRDRRPRRGPPVNQPRAWE